MGLINPNFKMLSIFAAVLKKRKQKQLTDLPDEVILKLFSYLSLKDLGRWTKVSKRMRSICWDKALPYGQMKKKYEKENDPYYSEDHLGLLKNLLVDMKHRNPNVWQNFERFVNILKHNPTMMEFVLKTMHKHFTELTCLYISAAAEGAEWIW